MTDFPPWAAIYVIQCQQYYKIGIARESVKTRMRILQTGNPFKLYLVCVIPCANPEEVENEIHTMLDRCKVRGEWFHLSAADLDNLKRESATCIREYNYWLQEVNQ